MGNMEQVGASKKTYIFMMCLNVLILHYKTIEKTIGCVSSVLETEPRANVIIIDNYSNDGTLETLKCKYADNIRIAFICLDENKGFAKANNAGMRYLHENGAQYTVVTNNDIVFKPNSIKHLVESLKKTDSILSAPKVINADNSIMDSVQLYRDHNIYEYLYHRMKSRFCCSNNYLAEECNDITPIKSFSGCCFACDLEKMNSIDYFDEHTFLYFEEPILSLKIEKAGYDMVFVPEAEVVHYHGASTSRNSLFAKKCKLDSQEYYFINFLHVNKFLLVIYKWLKEFRYKRQIVNSNMF